MTLGVIVAFFWYFNRLFPAVLQICNLPQQIFSARGSLDKVFGLLDEPLLFVNSDSAAALCTLKPCGTLFLKMFRSAMARAACPWSYRT